MGQSHCKNCNNFNFYEKIIWMLGNDSGLTDQQQGHNLSKLKTLAQCVGWLKLMPTHFTTYPKTISHEPIHFVKPVNVSDNTEVNT